MKKRKRNRVGDPRWNIDLIAFVVVVVLALGFVVQMGSIRNDMDKMFPVFLISLIGFLSVVLLIKGLVKPEKRGEFFSESNPRRVFIVMGLCAIWACLLEPLGFYLASWIFICLLSMLLDRKLQEKGTPKGREVLTIFGVNLLITALLYVVFSLLLGVRVPKGILV